MSHLQLLKMGVRLREFFYYILIKNFCINSEINMTIINEGLYNAEKNLTLYHPLINFGNGIIIQGEINSTKYIKQNVRITKLSAYIPYLKYKCLALIKLDVEGSEAKALEGGIDLIIKFHTPFIFIEWTPKLIKRKGTDPRLFLEMFVKNGYKISIKNFLSKKYISIESLLHIEQTNIYIVYEPMLK